MKIFSTILFVLTVSTADVFAQAQSDVDYFAGKWSVLVKGTPNGDSRMVFALDKSDTGLTGVVQDTTGVEISKIDKIEVVPGKITVFFNAQGFDVDMALNKKDEDHVTGSLMGMFTVEGSRKKK